MSATYALYGRWKALKKLPSDRQAARVLDLDPSAITLWKNGRNGSVSVIEKMAKELGEDPILTIISAFEEASAAEADKKTWRRLSKRFGSAAAVALALGMGLSLPEPVQAGISANSGQGSIHYAKFPPRRRDHVSHGRTSQGSIADLG